MAAAIVFSLLLIVIAKTVAHRARFRDRKEYNEHVAAPPTKRSRPGIPSGELEKEAEKEEDTVAPGGRSSSTSTTTESSPTTSRRSSYWSQFSNHYDPKDSTKDLVNFPGNKSVFSSTAPPSILSYRIQFDPHRPALPALPATLRPATLSPATSIHRITHAPSLRRPSLHLGARPPSPRTPLSAVPRLPTLHARFALPDEPLDPRTPPSPASSHHHQSSYPFPHSAISPSSYNYGFPQSAPSPSSSNTAFSFPFSTPHSFNHPTSPLSPTFSYHSPHDFSPHDFSHNDPSPYDPSPHDISPHDPSPLDPTDSLPSPHRPSNSNASPSLPLPFPPSPVLPMATLAPPPKGRVEFTFPKPLTLGLRRKSEAVPYDDWKGPIERSLSISVETLKEEMEELEGGPY